jgi:hypothetical protein
MILAVGGLILLGVTAMTALILLTVRWTRAALILFAAGGLGAAAFLALAALSFLHPLFNSDRHTIIVLAALAVLVGGIGQFVAALRSGRAYGWAVGFAAAGLLTGLIAFYVDLIVPGGVTDLGRFTLNVRDLHVWIAGAGLFLSIASLALALLVPAPSRSAPQTPRPG